MVDARRESRGDGTDVKRLDPEILSPQTMTRHGLTIAAAELEHLPLTWKLTDL